jgi:riboflavin synthase
MFTGIIQEIGAIRRIETRTGTGAAEDRRIEVSFATLARERLNLGDSICVDGVCLTVTALGASSFHADVSGETLRVTTLGTKSAGARVNLEPALRAGDSLGGHWVSGHVDGVAEVLSTANDSRSLRVEFAAPRGVSLSVLIGYWDSRIAQVRRLRPKGRAS